MIKRKLFKVDGKGNITEHIVEFDNVPGNSENEKLKSINSFHNKIKEKFNEKILEVSSKSNDLLGKELSAFNLLIEYNNKNIYFESFFQGSKVFTNGGPFIDILYSKPWEAKADKRIRNSGTIVSFRVNVIDYPIEPKTLFYNYFYSKAFINSNKSIEKINEYNIFTDIEFNHEVSINCQAHAVAILVSLYRKNKLDESLKTIDEYIKNVYN